MPYASFLRTVLLPETKAIPVGNCSGTAQMQHKFQKLQFSYICSHRSCTNDDTNGMTECKWFCFFIRRCHILSPRWPKQGVFPKSSSSFPTSLRRRAAAPQGVGSFSVHYCPERAFPPSAVVSTAAELEESHTPTDVQGKDSKSKRKAKSNL